MKPVSLCTMRHMPSTKSLQNWKERVCDPDKAVWVKGGCSPTLVLLRLEGWGVATCSVNCDVFASERLADEVGHHAAVKGVPGGREIR